MREIVPYTDRFELQQAIDNGGRFYNIFSKAGDSVVTKGELAKAAGVCGADHRAILFLELAKWELDVYDQNWIVDLLEPKLRDRYESMKPSRLKPSEVEKQGKLGSAVIATGYLRYLEDQTKLNGFITVPIMVGNVTTYSMVPIYQNYAIFEMFDDEANQSANCLIALVKDETLDHHGPSRIGGLLRELKSKDEPAACSHFLEAYYYTKWESAGD